MEIALIFIVLIALSLGAKASLVVLAVGALALLVVVSLRGAANTDEQGT